MQVNIGSNWRCSCLSKRWQFDYLRTRLYCRAKFYSTICQQGEENIPTNCQLDTHTVANIHDNSNKDNNISLLKTVVNISTLVTLQWKEKCLIHWQTVDVIIRTYNKVTKWQTVDVTIRRYNISFEFPILPFSTSKSFTVVFASGFVTRLKFCRETFVLFCWWGIRAWYWRWWHLS